jgi:hypothetical protein
MSTGKKSTEQLWRESVTAIDHYLIPLAFSLLCFLTLVQLVTKVPSIRSHVDAVSGRFVSMPADVIPASVQSERADVTLYISPVYARPDVIVYVNGKAVGDFNKSSMVVSVREGDEIAVQATQPGTTVVQVDHNNVNLLTPAPGMTVDVTSPNRMYKLALARFIR